jgi:hypothetical protein
VDHSFSQLLVHVVNKAAAKNDAGYSYGNRCETYGRSRCLPEQIPQGEAEKNCAS